MDWPLEGLPGSARFLGTLAARANDVDLMPSYQPSSGLGRFTANIL